MSVGDGLRALQPALSPPAYSNQQNNSPSFKCTTLVFPTWLPPMKQGWLGKSVGNSLQNWACVCLSRYEPYVPHQRASIDSSQMKTTMPLNSHREGHRHSALMSHWHTVGSGTEAHPPRTELFSASQGCFVLPSYQLQYYCFALDTFLLLS